MTYRHRAIVERRGRRAVNDGRIRLPLTIYGRNENPDLVQSIYNINGYENQATREPVENHLPRSLFGLRDIQRPLIIASLSRSTFSPSPDRWRRSSAP